MALREVREVVASAARTSSGQSASQDVPLGRVLALGVNVTAVSGTTPSLDVSVEWSMDGTTWARGDPADAFAALNAVASRVKSFVVKAPRYRVAWTIAGALPSFTFSVREFVPE